MQAFRVVTVESRYRRRLRQQCRDAHRRRRIALAMTRTVPWQYTSSARQFDCGPVWGTVRLRYVYKRVEFGVGTVVGVSAWRETTYLGYEVVDHSGRHGNPAVREVRGRGVWYDAAEIKFAVGTSPQVRRA